MVNYMSLCNLCVLCVSVLRIRWKGHHRDTKNTEVAQHLKYFAPRVHI